MTLVVRSMRAASDRERAVEQAVVATLAYADVFDWPLAPEEVHRFLPLRAQRDEVLAALRSPGLGDLVRLIDGYVTLVGREMLVSERRRRESVSAALWPRAIGWARQIAVLPFVRLVAVTGSLAVGAASDEADIDLLVVTRDGRLWLTRAMTIGLVRAAAARGVNLCPNYFIAESALDLAERDLFTAHELVQMVPLVGHATFQELIERNAWYRDFLPNHPGPPAPPIAASKAGSLRTGAERALGTRLVDRLEGWEMARKVTRLRAAGDSAEARFDATVCKGHLDGHRRRSLAAFHQLLVHLGDGQAVAGGPGPTVEP